jgi:predicted transglutaminase-like cysteine proteinase
MHQDIIDHINANFTYQYDRDQYGKPDRWKIMEGPQYVGDCEDYSLTVLWHIAGKSWFKFWWLQLTGKAALKRCQVRSGEYHIILRYGDLCIDNIQQRWTTQAYMEDQGYNFVFVMPVLNTAICMLIKR